MPAQGAGTAPSECRRLHARGLSWPLARCMPPGAPAFAATQLSGANLTLRESRSKDGATATGGPAGLWGRTPCTAPTGARAHTRQIASMKLISIKGIYVATLVYQLYRIQFAPSAPGLAASQAAGRLQVHAPLALRMLQRTGRVTRHGCSEAALAGRPARRGRLPSWRRSYRGSRAHRSRMSMFRAGRTPRQSSACALHPDSARAADQRARARQACNLQLATAAADASCARGAQCCTSACAASEGVPALQARRGRMHAPVL